MKKISIGSVAASLIEKNDCIIIGSGTTVQAFAKNIRPIGNLTVLTAALNVAAALIHHPRSRSFSVRRYAQEKFFLCYRPLCRKDPGRFFVQQILLGVDGIDLEFGPHYYQCCRSATQ